MRTGRWVVSVAFVLLSIVIVVPMSPRTAVGDEPEPTEFLADSPPPTYRPCATPTPSPTSTPAPSATPTATQSPLPSATPGPTNAPSWGPPPASRLGAPEIFGYLPNWDLDAHIDYGAITTIAYFGLAAGANGQLVRTKANGGPTTEYSRWQSAKVNNVISQAHANGVKFVLTVERMAWDDGTKAATRTLLGNVALRTSLVTDIVNEVTLRGIDGVSLDFEPILSDQRANFAAFVGELRAGLYAANPAHQLTFAATGSQPGQTYQMIGALTASGAADAVIIMGYPLRGLDARYAGGLAPLYSPTSFDLKQIANAYLERVAADKIVMALPWYGRQWPTLTSNVNSEVQSDRRLYDRPHNIGYTNALQLAANHGRQLDPAEQSAWTAFQWRYCAEAPDTWKEVYYDDVETLGYKYDWVASKGMAGIGIWALGYDNDQPELWQLLRVKYRGLVDTTPPAGSMNAVDPVAQCASPYVRLDFDLDDGVDGSGAVYIRISNVPDVSATGLLTLGRTFPAFDEISWPTDDASTGGSTTFGNRTVYAQWADVAGNWSPVSSVALDLAAPAGGTFSIAGGATAVADPIIPVSFTSTGARTIDRVRFSSDGSTGPDGAMVEAVEAAPGETVSFSLIDPATGGLDADGRTAVYGQWHDSAGCWSTPKAFQLKLDRTGPVGTLSIVGAPAYVLVPSVQLLAAATDNGSGVARMQLSNDGTTWTDVASSTTPITWSAGNLADGPWTVSARWQDGAGTWSAVATASTFLDAQGPTGMVMINDGAIATATDQVTVSAPASDAGSGVAELLLSNSPDQSAGVLTGATSFVPGASVAWSLKGTATNLTEGVHTVYAQWRDGAGHWSTVASASIIVDTGPPLVGKPLPALRAGVQMGAQSVPISATWTAVNSGSGVAEHRVALARDGRPWPTPTVVSGPAFSGTIEPGVAWRLRVGATDAIGNVSAQVQSDPFTATISQENATGVTYTGTWKRVAVSGSLGGSTRYATAKGATAKLSFTGRSVAWVAPLGTNRGTAKVLIDGVVVATIDLRAPAQSRMLVFSRTWLSTGQPHDQDQGSRHGPRRPGCFRRPEVTVAATMPR